MSNLLSILTGANVEVQTLHAFLQKIAEGGSDLAPVAADLLAKIDAAGASVDIAGLAVVVPKEAFDSLMGKFDGRFHPGGAA